MLQNPGKSAARRGYPIHAYVGANGGGKSACMVWDTLPSLNSGRPVLSTVRLLDYVNPRECTDADCEADPRSGHYVRALPEPHIIASLFAAEPDPQRRIQELATLGLITHVHKAAHPLYVPLVDWQQVLDARGCDLLLDEVTGAASSRESAGLPAAVANKLVQLRRNDVTVRWSAPAWTRADKIIRECSQAVTYCRGFLAKSVKDDAGQRLWRNRRLFSWRTYDATLFEDFTAGKREDLSTLVSDLHWGPKSPAFQAYDTFDSVLTVGTVTETGRCYRCGGTRRAPACSCADSKGRAGARGERAGSPAGGAREPLAPVGPVSLSDALDCSNHESEHVPV